MNKSSLIDSICGAVFGSAAQPGAAVLIARDGRTLFERCYGLADLENGTPITPETSFNIASVSKQFTAVAVLQLVQKGLLSLDESVARHFPEFKGSIWKDITIAHLLSHSSGVPSTRKGYSRKQRIFADDALSIEYFNTLDSLNFTPGTMYEYVNPTFVLCGRLVERISGEEFTEYVRKHIFLPAGMNATVYFDPAAQDTIPNMSHAYVRCDDGSWHRFEYGEEPFFATKPDGGIYTSVREFAKWENAQLNSLVLKPETLADAQSPHIRVWGSPFSDYQNRPNTSYGYGWFVETVSDDSSRHHGTVAYHTGDNGGFKIMAARYPVSKTLVLIFANRNDWDRWQLLQNIEEVLF